jgi:predicted HicB family RNase H-like nuclease
MGPFYTHTGPMKQLNLRLPDYLHTKLREAAERDHRSLNSEIVHLLEQALCRPSGHDASSR